MGIEVKEAAQYARVILLELQRIASHLLWLGTFCNDLGQMFTIFMWSFRERAKVLKLLEDVSGSRMFYVNLRLGGLSKELPPDFSERVYALVEYLEEKIPQYKDILDENSFFMERTKGIGKLSREDAINLGATGPVLRASGVYYDVRKNFPYYVYDKINFSIPTRSTGDVYDRYKVRYEEMLESLGIIKQALESMPESSVVGLPIKLSSPPVKPDPVAVERELPRGNGVIYMIPDKLKPARIAMRPPSFINISLLPKLCKGGKFADIFPILGSLDVVVAEIDK
jgi:NADH-quinone oxidoreductase subunit D